MYAVHEERWHSWGQRNINGLYAAEADVSEAAICEKHWSDEHKPAVLPNESFQAKCNFQLQPPTAERDCVEAEPPARSHEVW